MVTISKKIGKRDRSFVFIKTLSKVSKNYGFITTTVDNKFMTFNGFSTKAEAETWLEQMRYSSKDPIGDFVKRKCL